MKTIKKYAFIYIITVKSQLIYIKSTIASIVKSIINFIIQISLWSTLISTGYRSDINLQDMIIYLMLNSFILTLTKANLAVDIEEEIENGSILFHITRPISYQLYLLSTMLGKNTYKTITATVPIILLGSLLVGLPRPASFYHFLLFVLLSVFGVLIIFYLIYNVGLLAFWLQKTWYLSWYLNAGVTFLGGTIVPLWFYPQFIYNASRLLPFRYIAFEPVNCYLGRISVHDLGLSLAISIAWCLILIITGRLLWKRVNSKLAINGG